VGLLVLLPVLVIQGIAPAPLGAYAANRGGQNRVPEAAIPPGDGLPAATGGAVDMWMGEFLYYTERRPSEVRGEVVRLVGFAAPEPEVPGAFRLTRFAITCCAADALPLQVVVIGSPSVPASDQWLVVEASWGGEIHVTADGFGLPVLEFSESTPIPAPASPYEY
jgi:uncharacterized repeat protein (TIGR03943 family)